MNIFRHIAQSHCYTQSYYQNISLNKTYRKNENQLALPGVDAAATCTSRQTQFNNSVSNNSEYEVFVSGEKTF